MTTHYGRNNSPQAISSFSLTNTSSATTVLPVVAQTAELAHEETSLNIRRGQLVASTALIQALGAGWDATQLPSRSRIEENVPLNFTPFPPPAEEVRAR